MSEACVKNKAFHVLWTGPKKVMRRYELITQVLSVLQWKKLYGEITLYVDDIAKNIMEYYNISQFYDGINTDALVDFKLNNAGKYWSAGKMIAMKLEPLGSVFLDLDLILWEKFLFSNNALTVLHREVLNDIIYPTKEEMSQYFNTPSVSLDDKYDFKEPSCNMALSRFTNQNFKDEYIKRFFDIVYDTNDSFDGGRAVVYAEQRMLAMLAKLRGISINTIEEQINLGETKLFTHLWIGKFTYNRDPKKITEILEDLFKRLYPKESEILKMSSWMELNI